MNWPRSLPPFPIGIDLVQDDNSIRTETDMGPAKRRRRYTAVSKRIAVRGWHLRGDDLEVLLDFYEVQTRGGSDYFIMTEPLVNGFVAGLSGRFDGPPRWSIVNPSDHDGTRLAQVDIDIEVLP